MKITTKFVVCQWEDITSFEGWRYIKEEKFENVRPITTGFLISYDKDYLVLCQTLCDDGVGNNIFKIPTGNIMWVETLVGGKWRTLKKEKK